MAGIPWATMKFEWDPEKNRINLRKHGVRFEDAIRVLTPRSLCSTCSTSSTPIS